MVPTTPDTTQTHSESMQEQNTRSAAAPPRTYDVLLGLTTLAIFTQAITAGLFVNRDGSTESLITAHGVMADVSWVLALVTAGYAFLKIRRVNSLLFLGSVLLFVLDIAQAGIGHLITDDGVDWLITVHVPLAMLIFGLAIWLSARTARVRRRPGAAAEPVPYPTA